MRLLAIYNGKNKRFRRDGNEFKREAEAWMEANGDGTKPVLGLLGTNPNRLVDVRDGRIRAEIRTMTQGLDVLAIFDHGRPMDLPRMREDLGNVKGLAATIAGVTDKITIVLYACSCGRGWWGRRGFRWMNKKNKADMETMSVSYNPRDGYAIALCSELAKLGVDATICAHLTAGHTTQNPHVVLVEQIGSSQLLGIRRGRPFAPGDDKWKQWKRDLKGPLRFTFWR